MKQGDKGEAVKSLQRSLTLAGFSCQADGIYGPATVSQVKKFQSSVGIVADGVAGPATLAALNRPTTSFAPLVPRPGMQHAGELVAKMAEKLWEQDVYDPEPGDKAINAVRCKTVISQFTVACNWGPYEGNHSVEWCAMFAMYCWHKAANLDAKWLAHFSQSTYRLWAWANYLDFDGHKNPKPVFSTPLEEPFRTYTDLRESQDYRTTVQRGDIVIVGDGNPKTGDHVTVAVEVFKDHIVTISGNGGGTNSKGKNNNGISKKTYTRGASGYAPMFLVVPAFGDLKLEAP